MTIPNSSVPGGNNPNPSGEGGPGDGAPGGGNGVPTPDPKPGDTVAHTTYLKVLDEAKAAKAERDRLKRELDERDRKTAEQSGDWQKLLQLEREEKERIQRERDELAGKVTTIETQTTQVRKLAAIVKATGGDVDPKWHDLLADRFLPEVVVHPETGEIDQASVTAAVAKLRSTYPEVIKGRVPGVPNSDPAASGTALKTIRRSEWKKLHSSQMKQYRPEQIIDD